MSDPCGLAISAQEGDTQKNLEAQSAKKEFLGSGHSRESSEAFVAKLTSQIHEKVLSELQGSINEMVAEAVQKSQEKLQAEVLELRNLYVQLFEDVYEEIYERVELHLERINKKIQEDILACKQENVLQKKENEKLRVQFQEFGESI